MIATAWVILNVVAPAGSPDVFVKLYGHEDYMAFIIIGVALSSLLFTAVQQGGDLLYEEQVFGTLEVTFVSPMNRFSWMFGKTLGMMVNGIIGLFIVALIGWIFFGIRIENTISFFTAALGAFMTLVALQGVGFMIGGIGILAKEPHQLIQMLMPFLSFISGMMFPVKILPTWLQYISYSFPLTHGLNIVRRSIMHGWGPDMFIPDFISLTILMIIYPIVGYSIFKKLENRAKSTGSFSTF
jgi:ABC-2 type transport system permease protein